MGRIGTLSIALSEDLAAAVREAVDSGAYASPSEVMDEALRLWRDPREEEEDPAEVARLRALVEEGVASGPGRYGSIEEILAEAHRRFAAHNA